MLTADHGCDPASPRTDHTREHVPLLARFAGDGGRRHDGPMAESARACLRGWPGRGSPRCPATHSFECRAGGTGPGVG